MNLIDVSSILNDATLDQGIRNIISFESSRNEMYSRVDASLDLLLKKLFLFEVKPSLKLLFWITCSSLIPITLIAMEVL